MMNDMRVWWLAAFLGISLIGGVGVLFASSEKIMLKGGIFGAPAYKGILLTSSTKDGVPFIEAYKRNKPLSPRPDVIRAIYATSWSAGSSKKITYLIDFIRRNNLNALVIDIKDYSGYVAYATDAEPAKTYGAFESRIKHIDELVRQLHENNIYIIGRVAVFQDQALAKARPDLAVKSAATGEVWRDRNRLAWIDPSSREAWSYNVAIARDAVSHGIDEINFDYIRFPSDGNLDDFSYPIWDGVATKREVMRDFFSYLRGELKNVVISADIFGITLIRASDEGIGQYLEDAIKFFDIIAPMVYPSHYAHGFIGFKNPAEYPYEVVMYSLERARERLNALAYGTNSSGTLRVASSSRQGIVPSENVHGISHVRPWLQAFDLGAVYGAQEINAQIRAVEESGAKGFMLWDPANIYKDFYLL